MGYLHPFHLQKDRFARKLTIATPVICHPARVATQRRMGYAGIEFDSKTQLYHTSDIRGVHVADEVKTVGVQPAKRRTSRVMCA